MTDFYFEIVYFMDLNYSNTLIECNFTKLIILLTLMYKEIEFDFDSPNCYVTGLHLKRSSSELIQKQLCQTFI